MAHNSDMKELFILSKGLKSQCNFSWHIILIKDKDGNVIMQGVSVQLFMAHNSDDPDTCCPANAKVSVQLFMAHNSDTIVDLERIAHDVSVQLFMAHNSDIASMNPCDNHWLSQCNFSWHITLTTNGTWGCVTRIVSVQLFMAHNSDLLK